MLGLEEEEKERQERAIRKYQWCVKRASKRKYSCGKISLWKSKYSQGNYPCGQYSQGKVSLRRKKSCKKDKFLGENETNCGQCLSRKDTTCSLGKDFARLRKTLYLCFFLHSLYSLSISFFPHCEENAEETQDQVFWKIRYEREKGGWLFLSKTMLQFETSSRFNALHKTQHHKTISTRYFGNGHKVFAICLEISYCKMI